MGMGLGCRCRKESMKLLAFLLTAIGLAAAPPDAEFWKTWGDGQAELSGYDLTFPRYGEKRRGSAVTIFVSETFSNSARVKADPGVHPDKDLFPVMKLNLVEDYQTGVYDYNDMTSAFVALAAVNNRPLGSLTKVTSSSQEWCGQTWQQLAFNDKSIRYVLHSYFDNEADQNKDLSSPAKGVSEDQLLLWARGMAAPYMKPGDSQQVPFLPGLRAVRQAHKPIAWTQATLSIAAKPIKVPWAGQQKEVLVHTVAISGGPTRTYYVETTAPFRVIGWSSTTGEEATLIKSIRSKYWQQNKEGFEKELQKLGLQSRPRRTT